MNEFVLILVTVSGKGEAEEIAMKLIGSGLSPCVNIIDSCTSIYQWKGEVRTDREALMLIKSRRDLFEDVRSLVEEAHSYDVPEIIGIGLECVSEKYAGFLRGFLAGA
jgi:periplasmic divalent cation tolerance protein